MKLFVDNLTVIDCSYLHPHYGVLGESWICDLVLEGALDSQSMVMDFGQVKKQIKQAIDGWVDHCLLVPMAIDIFISRRRKVPASTRGCVDITSYSGARRKPGPGPRKMLKFLA